MLDALAGALGHLSSLCEKHPIWAKDPECKKVKNSIEECIDFLIYQDRKMMTPDEVREFNNNLDDLRNGGA